MKKKKAKITKEQKVLNYWEKMGGRLFTKNAVKGPKIISDQLFNLFTVGSPNPYIIVLEDDQDDLRLKFWKVKEIQQAIWYYVKRLKRPIDKMSFNEFVVTDFSRIKSAKNVPNRSLLVECWSAILENPDMIGLTSKKDKWLKARLQELNKKEVVSEKVFINLCRYCKSLSKIWVPRDSGVTNLYYMYGLRPVFLDYAKAHSNSERWKISFMTGETFEADFLRWAIANYQIHKKTDSNKARQRKSK